MSEKQTQYIFFSNRLIDVIDHFRMHISKNRDLANEMDQSWIKNYQLWKALVNSTK